MKPLSVIRSTGKKPEKCHHHPPPFSLFNPRFSNVIASTCASPNEAPCSNLQGTKRNCAEANPPSLYELRRGRLAIPVEQEPLAEADHPCSLDLSGSPPQNRRTSPLRFDKLQGILAKAKKHNTLYSNPGQRHFPLLANTLWKLH